jgi:hypothetical protein
MDVSMMTREQLYQKFGPKLMDALAQVILDEVNILREEVGLTTRNSTQLTDAISNKLENIPDYNWMKDI